jgi:ABC-type transporter Mla subunit MlaD
MSPLLAAADAAATLRAVSTDDEKPTQETTAERRRPTVWIVLCGVLALAVVGLAIWAFSAQSDADDAQAQLDAQGRAAAAATPTPEPAQSVELDPEIQQQVDQLAEELGATGDAVEDIEQQLEQAAAKVDEAEQARDDAAGAVDAARAEAEAFKARFELTQTCLRGTLDAVGQAFEGGGLEAAAAELQKLSGSCAE